jgi:hypothetical protein
MQLDMERSGRLVLDTQLNREIFGALVRSYKRTCKLQAVLVAHFAA